MKCGRRLCWDERGEAMVAADAFIEQLWSLKKWQIGYPYLKGGTRAMVHCP